MTALFRIGSSEITKSAATTLADQSRIIYVRSGFKELQDKCHEPIVSNPFKFQSPLSFSGSANVTSHLYVVRSSSFTCAKRWAHTDIKFPDVTKYRNKLSQDPTACASNNADQSRVIHGLALGVGGMIALYSAKSLVVSAVLYKSPPKDMLALAETTIDLSEIPEGKNTTYMWRGKPVFVWHRNKQQIELAKSVDVGTLRDPQKDEERTKKPEWLVVVGVCTHLGCVPIAGQGNFGGYYCPCHGSHYDSSGRVRQGPAPLNLEVPAHMFDGSKLIIGKSDAK